jgi:hypothetical protein
MSEIARWSPRKRDPNSLKLNSPTPKKVMAIVAKQYIIEQQYQKLAGIAAGPATVPIP